MKKPKKQLCRIFLKDKDENDQADDKFFKNPERQGIHDWLNENWNKRTENGKENDIT